MPAKALTAQASLHDLEAMKTGSIGGDRGGLLVEARPPGEVAGAQRALSAGFAELTAREKLRYLGVTLANNDAFVTVYNALAALTASPPMNYPPR